MPVLYLMRHAQSEANVRDVLAGRQDFALTVQGHADAAAMAATFCASHGVGRVVSSPLVRARQTAQPFAAGLALPLAIDDRLSEQHLGRFAGLTYAQVEADPAYVTDRTRRWEWTPDGGGESYRDISLRVAAFLDDAARWPDDALVVTHAVTMRLFRACLERTLPRYPENIAANGEVWVCPLGIDGACPGITILNLGRSRDHRA
jgi:broad specificity phosphatase PhoE